MTYDYVDSTMRTYLLIAILVLAGCSTSRVASDPQSLHTCGGGHPRRVVLQRSPGDFAQGLDAPILQSGPDALSSGYVAQVTKVPYTRWFRIVRQFSAEATAVREMIEPSYTDIYPDPFSAGDHTYRRLDRRIAETSALHRYWRNCDPMVEGADALIFDPKTVVYSPYKIIPFREPFKVDAYAVVFEEPTAQALRERLEQFPSTPIAVLQTRAALYWIEQHRASEFASLVRALMPLPRRGYQPRPWDAVAAQATHTLAKLDRPEDRDVFLKVLLTHERTDTEKPEIVLMPPIDELGNASRTAANVLFCNHDTALIDPLKRVLDRAFYTSSAIYASILLAEFGQSDAIKAYAARVQPNYRASLFAIADRKPGTRFACPYEFGDHAI